jgi:CRP/FNR family transcriptional regulator
MLEAVALSDCDLILLPFKKLTALGRVHLELENVMYGVMSRELVREQAMIGSSCAGCDSTWRGNC